MWFFFLISSIAVYHIAFVNPRPENPSYTDFLSESNVAFNGLDESSLVPFDSSTQAPDFSASELLPLETDLYAESSDTLFDTLQIVDSSDELLQSSCETDDELQPYIKRDGEICAPKAAVEPLPLLKLPNLDDLEQIISSMRRERPNLQTHPISFIPGYSRDDELCPQPKRRLCCLGPLAGFVLTYDGWTLVRDCRDYGPWPCPARYDVCCRDFRNFEFADGKLVATGVMCHVLVENMNGVAWESSPAD